MVLWHQGLQRNEHRKRTGRGCECHLQRMRRESQRASDHERKDYGGGEKGKEAGMKKISIYRPSTIEEAIEMLSVHGTEAGVFAGGTDLLIRLKNRLKQAP